jgi:MarR family transcriptional regulator, lower aerobic nicotinate degradation pathway regulator
MAESKGEEMTIGRDPRLGTTSRTGLNSYAWNSRKHSAGTEGPRKKVRLTSPLNERPGYLLWRARHIADSIFTYECREFGITSSQYVVLAVVKETAGTDQVSVSRIAGLDRFTTALVLTNLIKRKLILRERSASDRRRYSLRLSAQGFETLKRILPGAARARARLLSPFARPEQRAFIRMLQQLVTTLNDDARARVDDDALPHNRHTSNRLFKKR